MTPNARLATILAFVTAVGALLTIHFGATVLIGIGVGLSLAMPWHWWMFARYDRWIVDNGDRLPPGDS